MRRLLMLLGCLIILVGCSSRADVVQVGTDTYSIRKESRTAMLGIDGLRDAAVAEASSYCESYSSSADALSESESRPPYIAGTSSWVEIQFQCIPWR
ncbi:MAG: hypothetical protein KJN90_14250 [Gammaproteobacteria bacterium]|nr:hypothetical protein [Gammaproteobacteria bacterium]